MPKRDVIVIGASAGGIEALSFLMRKFPSDLPAAVCAVIHTGPQGPGLLPKVLSRHSNLKCTQVTDRTPLEHGHCYIAPPSRHMLLERDRIRLVAGPVENRHRPSIDALFRSAANSLGTRVIGVILTGYLDDGTAGLFSIKRRGGLAVVQDPEDAFVSSMPESAITNVEVDYVLPLEEIPDLLVALTKETVATSVERKIMVKHSGNGESGSVPNENLSAYSCPECNGVLWEVQEGKMLRFKCRVGHSFSAETMADSQDEAVERALWAALRSLEERVDLTKRLAERAAQGRHPMAERHWRAQSEISAKNADILRKTLSATETPTELGEQHDPKLAENA